MERQTENGEKKEKEYPKAKLTVFVSSMFPKPKRKMLILTLIGPVQTRGKNKQKTKQKMEIEVNRGRHGLAICFGFCFVFCVLCFWFILSRTTLLRGQVFIVNGGSCKQYKDVIVKGINNARWHVTRRRSAVARWRRKEEDKEEH